MSISRSQVLAEPTLVGREKELEEIDNRVWQGKAQRPGQQELGRMLEVFYIFLHAFPWKQVSHN